MAPTEEEDANGVRQTPHGPAGVHPWEPRSHVSADALIFQLGPDAPERLAEITPTTRTWCSCAAMANERNSSMAVNIVAPGAMSMVATTSESTLATWAQGCSSHSTIMKVLHSSFSPNSCQSLFHTRRATPSLQSTACQSANSHDEFDEIDEFERRDKFCHELLARLLASEGEELLLLTALCSDGSKRWPTP